jgi:hypothetical protein
MKRLENPLKTALLGGDEAMSVAVQTRLIKNGGDSKTRCAGVATTPSAASYRPQAYLSFTNTAGGLFNHLCGSLFL